MSMYCLGSFCTRSKECARADAYNILIAEHPEIEWKNLLECADLGIWFVRQIDCIKNGYDDGIFPKRGGQR